MAVVISTDVIDALLLGVGGRRRELQDFPVLGDVWARFAEQPDRADADDPDKRVPAAHDLLINPTWERPTGEVAKLVARTGLAKGECGPYNRKVAYLQGLVVASLTLDDLIGVAIPATKWWDEINDRWNDDAYDDDDEADEEEGEPDNAKVRTWIEWELDEVLREEKLHSEQVTGRLTDGTRPANSVEMEAEDRQAAKLGLLLGVMKTAAAKEAPSEVPGPASGAAAGGAAKKPVPPVSAAQELLGRGRILDEGVRAVRLIIKRHRALSKAHKKRKDLARQPWNGLIFQVSLNRDAAPAIAESVGAIKADAARALFSISCKDVGWAVLDSGIDQNHPAFHDYDQIFSDQKRAEQDRLAKRKRPPPADSKP
ncbi:MAG: serine protease AprX, partial [Sphingomonadales bacterium]|nr:serine protease AprX [Sphingomonadales bacterium]